jgi:eukaryotic-like serine/threonine-protein kinase
MWGFRSEAQTLRSLDVPQVVKLFDYVEQPGQGAAIVMELVDGVSLHDMISHLGPTGPESALTVLKGSLLGLAAAHALGIVHRDYKPENVLVDGQGESKLSDFGVAVKEGKKALAAGTPLYMAPEQWNGAPNSPATDVYAATAVLFECLTGATPFSGKLTQLRAQHETAALPLDRVDPALRGFIARGMAKNAFDRPQSAIAFVAELEATAADAYGPDWEERGRSQLAERVLSLLPLLWHSQGGGGASSASTWDGGSGSGPRPRPRPRHRGPRRRAMTVATVAAAFVVAAAAVATAVTLSAKSHQAGLSEAATVTPTFTAQAVVTPPVTASPCTTAAAFTYTGTVTASAPGTVSYQWVYSSGKPGPVQTVQFASAGHQHVDGATERTKTSGTGWAELKLLGPAGVTSNKASYKLLCASSAGGITATASVTPATKAVPCQATAPAFTADGTITASKAETVSYYWALADGQDTAPATLTFGTAGTQAAEPLTITPSAVPSSGEAVLVVTSPVAAASAPATYTLTCTGQASAVAAASPATETLASCTAAAPVISFTGTVTAAAAGPVSYYWKLPSGNGPVHTLTFGAAGTQAVTAATYQPASDSSSGTGTIVVTGPDGAASNPASFALTCGAALSVTTDAAATATVGQAYSATATVTGGKDGYTWTATGLPAGLKATASGATLTISGTPTAAGASAVKLAVSDGATPKATSSASLTLTVSAPALTLAGGTLTAATEGAAYSATVAATGGTGTKTYAATGLPAGLTIAAATGTISGTPTAAGTSTVKVTVTDTATPAQTATASYTLVVSAPALTLTGETLAAGTSGAAYSATVAAAGGTGTKTYAATGLPAGLTIGAATGTISGTPTVTATTTYTVVVTVTDTASPAQTATADFSITIDAVTVSTSPTPTPTPTTASPTPSPTVTVPAR